MKRYDAVIIGAGPGGYESALELAHAGLKTLLVDHNKERIGGTCLNEGCIPSKAYLQSADYASKASYFNSCGVMLELKGMNMKALREKTVSLKDEIRSGVFWLLDQAGIEMLYGSANFIDANTIEVSGEKIGFEKCIVATGSKARELPLLPVDKKRVISSKEVFDLEELPASVVIVGGGPIGCEFATFFNAFGVEVTLLVRGEQLLSSEDEDVSKALLRAFKKRDIKVITSTLIQKAEIDEQEVRLYLDTDECIKSELVLCATGRIPYTQGLLPENAGIELDTKGFVNVNEAFQTVQKHIYAIGDCIDTYAFAHTAYAEAKIAAHNIISGETRSNTHITPITTYTDPAIASCGLKEKEAAEQGHAVEIKKVVFKVNAKAKILGDDSGFAKLVVSADSGVILGASIIGAEATEIIHELVLAVEKKLTYMDVKEMIHAHPSVSEIIRYL